MEGLLITTLCDLPAGNACTIIGVDDSLPVKKRLDELGLFTGADIDKLQVGPQGNPVAVRVCGAVLALRADDTRYISVAY